MMDGRIRLERKKLVGLAALLLTVIGCEKRPEAPARPAPSVTVAQPVSERLIEWNEYTARLAAVEAVEIRPRVSGYIDSVHFTEGERVAEGDLLFSIDPRPFVAEVNRAKAGLAQANAAASLGRANLKRAIELARTQVISKEEADIRQSESLQADADVEEARANLDAATLQLDYTKISAPISGIAGRYLVTRGNLIQGGSGQGTLLTTVVPHDPIYAYFETDEAAVLSSIRRFFEGKIAGRGEEGSRPIEMELADETDFPRRGEVDFIDNQLDTDTATLLIRGKFENDNFLLTPGMFARVRVPASDEYDAILIPDEAIGADLSQRFVWVLGEDNKVERRTVELGPHHQKLRIVRSGLSTDDQLVIRGTQTLRPGTEVKPEEGRIDTGDAEPTPTPAATPVEEDAR